MNVTLNMNHKLLITIIKKGNASKVVKATKSAGAEGGTILLGKGTGIHEKHTFLGIPIEPEKEIILTLVQESKVDCVLKVIEKAAKLDQPGTGIAFIVDAKKATGICHLLNIKTHIDCKEDNITMDKTLLYDLIVSIVNKCNADKVVDASKEAGAEGGTIIYGRGTGIHEQAKLFSIQIEPEKEVVLTLIERSLTDTVLRAIEEKAELNKPGKGIAFVLEVERTAGINHILNRLVNEEVGDGNA